MVFKGADDFSDHESESRDSMCVNRGRLVFGTQPSPDIVGLAQSACWILIECNSRSSFEILFFGAEAGFGRGFHTPLLQRIEITIQHPYEPCEHIGLLRDLIFHASREQRVAMFLLRVLMIGDVVGDSRTWQEICAVAH